MAKQSPSEELKQDPRDVAIYNRMRDLVSSGLDFNPKEYDAENG